MRAKFPGDDFPEAGVDHEERAQVYQRGFPLWSGEGEVAGQGPPPLDQAPGPLIPVLIAPPITGG